MTSKEIRKSFIDFFKSKNHKFVKSAPVAPLDDPTLLFTNAGMNQFKSIFLGESNSELSRAVNSQKCIRVSGKHNDLEEVGVDTFHHTFFEMLGNWSFGDYYKKEAIKWSWELLTEVWGLDKKRLWVSVYVNDNEAYEVWEKETDINPNRILRFGDEENFWEMGETGPCGPCSEIHYYIGEDESNQNSSGVNKNSDYWELWNLVFIQNERLKDGTLIELPNKHVDTGAGLERITSVLQNKVSNYETDLFMPIMLEVELISSSKIDTNVVPYQVISDHIRMLVFSISDGALPSNEGRGYVLRRILRRASRFGRTIGIYEPFLYKLVSVVSDIMSDDYKEIQDNKSLITETIKREEINFNKTLDRGLRHFDNLIKSIPGKIIPGNSVFKLYDTYGFPIDLTKLLATEHNLEVDENTFNDLMTKQKDKAKKTGKFNMSFSELNWIVIKDISDSNFIGYQHTKSTSSAVKYSKHKNKIFIILDSTPFYAESGGQIADTGIIYQENIRLKVEDVQKLGDSFIHICKYESEGVLDFKALLNCEIDKGRRQRIRNNHTATHLMHSALKHVLGSECSQAGSLVHDEYLRFDVTYDSKIKDNDIIGVEKIVNKEIQKNSELEISTKSYDDAKNSGSISLFGEKYGDEVRVVKSGEFSNELCGGTHVNRTGDIGIFKIVEESSLASGVRRIVALTGGYALNYFQNQMITMSKVNRLMNCNTVDLDLKVQNLLYDKKKLEKESKQNKIKSASNVSDWLLESKNINNFSLVIQKLENLDTDSLKQLASDLILKIDDGIGILFSSYKGNAGAVVVVTESLIKHQITAGNVAKEIGKNMSGGGGGRPSLATAGGKNNVNLLDNCLSKTTKFVTNLLELI